ncbi:hypothetical protein Ddye_007599 [Dipteronia dyeriana]|uniref:Uncharacterized protein n=1 Tax=Dipteronia dyeriana TaxID=168575 RepID=A0AAD9XK48_9ROSI|nr:hypothetical protein Ddye_007599 [Dipteronia dyeriana]
MDSFSSRRWPMMMQTQRSVKNTQIATQTSKPNNQNHPKPLTKSITVTPPTTDWCSNSNKFKLKAAMTTTSTRSDINDQEPTGSIWCINMSSPSVRGWWSTWKKNGRERAGAEAEAEGNNSWREHSRFINSKSSYLSRLGCGGTREITCTTDGKPNRCWTCTRSIVSEDNSVVATST